MPLYDPYGQLVSLTTRDVEGDKNFQHWHESFDKSRYLYGLDVAKDDIRRQEKVIVVEGQFDTTCYHSKGLKVTTGILGTAFTIMHVCALIRYSSEIYLMFDPDDSGIKSMQRAADMYEQYKLANYGISFYYVQLPQGYDPDDYIVEFGVKGVFSLMKEAKERNQKKEPQWTLS